MAHPRSIHSTIPLGVRENFSKAACRPNLCPPPPRSILALEAGFKALQSLGGMPAISTHTFALSRYLYEQLKGLRHSNRASVCEIYGDSKGWESAETQGPTGVWEWL